MNVIHRRAVGDEYINSLYDTAFTLIASELPATCPVVVEIGSGFMRQDGQSDSIIRTDVSPSVDLDVICDARSLPFANGSVDALILKDALHHIPDVSTFLQEAVRVLRSGGRVVVFDPFWGFLARLVYRHLHHEPYDPQSTGWSFRSESPMESNQAISFILLRRDRNELLGRFPDLSIREIGAHVGPSFLLSGGLSRRTPISGLLLSRMLQWESRRGRWFDNFRFFYLYSFERR